MDFPAGGVLPGKPSVDGGIDEFPLFRETSRSNRPSRARSSVSSARNAANSRA